MKSIYIFFVHFQNLITMIFKWPKNSMRQLEIEIAKERNYFILQSIVIFHQEPNEITFISIKCTYFNLHFKKVMYYYFYLLLLFYVNNVLFLKFPFRVCYLNKNAMSLIVSDYFIF